MLLSHFNDMFSAYLLYPSEWDLADYLLHECVVACECQGTCICEQLPLSPANIWGAAHLLRALHKLPDFLKIPDYDHDHVGNGNLNVEEDLNAEAESDDDEPMSSNKRHRELVVESLHHYQAVFNDIIQFVAAHKDEFLPAMAASGGDNENAMDIEQGQGQGSGLEQERGRGDGQGYTVTSIRRPSLTKTSSTSSSSGSANGEERSLLHTPATHRNATDAAAVTGGSEIAVRAVKQPFKLKESMGSGIVATPTPTPVGTQSQSQSQSQPQSQSQSESTQSPRAVAINAKTPVTANKRSPPTVATVTATAADGDADDGDSDADLDIAPAERKYIRLNGTYKNRLAYLRNQDKDMLGSGWIDVMAVALDAKRPAKVYTVSDKYIKEHWDDDLMLTAEEKEAIKEGPTNPAAAGDNSAVVAPAAAAAATQASTGRLDTSTKVTSRQSPPAAASAAVAVGSGNGVATACKDRKYIRMWGGSFKGRLVYINANNKDVFGNNQTVHFFAIGLDASRPSGKSSTTGRAVKEHWDDDLQMTAKEQEAVRALEASAGKRGKDDLMLTAEEQEAIEEGPTNPGVAAAAAAGGDNSAVAAPAAAPAVAASVVVAAAPVVAAAGTAIDETSNASVDTSAKAPVANNAPPAAVAAATATATATATAAADDGDSDADLDIAPAERKYIRLNGRCKHRLAYLRKQDMDLLGNDDAIDVISVALDAKRPAKVYSVPGKYIKEHWDDDLMLTAEEQEAIKEGPTNTGAVAAVAAAGDNSAVAAPTVAASVVVAAAPVVAAAGTATEETSSALVANKQSPAAVAAATATATTAAAGATTSATTAAAAGGSDNGVVTARTDRKYVRLWSGPFKGRVAYFKAQGKESLGGNQTVNFCVIGLDASRPSGRYSASGKAVKEHWNDPLEITAEEQEAVRVSEGSTGKGRKGGSTSGGNSSVSEDGQQPSASSSQQPLSATEEVPAKTLKRKIDASGCADEVDSGHDIPPHDRARLAAANALSMNDANDATPSASTCETQPHGIPSPQTSSSASSSSSSAGGHNPVVSPTLLAPAQESAPVPASGPVPASVSGPEPVVENEVMMDENTAATEQHDDDSEVGTAIQTEIGSVTDIDSTAPHRMDVDGATDSLSQSQPLSQSQTQAQPRLLSQSQPQAQAQLLSQSQPIVHGDGDVQASEGGGVDMQEQGEGQGQGGNGSSSMDVEGEEVDRPLSVPIIHYQQQQHHQQQPEEQQQQQQQPAEVIDISEETEESTGPADAPHSADSCLHQGGVAVSPGVLPSSSSSSAASAVPLSLEIKTEMVEQITAGDDENGQA